MRKINLYHNKTLVRKIQFKQLFLNCTILVGYEVKTANIPYSVFYVYNRNNVVLPETA